MKPSKKIGTRLLEVNKKLGIDKVVNAVTKGDCGCKKRAAKLDALHEGISNTVSSMFQKNKNK